MTRFRSGWWIVPAAILAFSAYALAFDYVARRVTEGLV
jgi:hypothetical protein